MKKAAPKGEGLPGSIPPIFPDISQYEINSLLSLEILLSKDLTTIEKI